MLRIVELFAGTGNFAKGFSKYGTTVFANDVNRFVEITYNANHELPLVRADVWDVLPHIPPHDILLAGFPCQPFSIIRSDRKGMNDAERGHLFFAIAEALKLHHPPYFVLENVPGIFTSNNGKDYEVILETIQEIGYHLHVIKLSPHVHANIPQTRWRVFFVGFLDKSQRDKFLPPSPVDLTRNFREFLEKDVDSRFFYKLDGIIYSKIKDFVVRPDRVYDYFSSRNIREIKSGLVKTIATGSNRNTLPIILDDQNRFADLGFSQIRYMTPRECARLQGMDDDYLFPVSDTQAYKMIGNAVNVAVACRLADAIFGN